GRPTVHRVLTALTLPLLPVAVGVAAAHRRLRRDLAERLGLVVAPAQPGSTWIHAASVGEMAVVEGILADLPRPVLVTTDTDTGRDAAMRLAVRHRGVHSSICPIDHALTIAPLWAEARPRLVGFVEGTFWPGLAWRARRAGVPVWRIAAQASARTRRVPRALLRALWAPTDRVWARDAEQAAFFGRVHADVRVLGDPKRWGDPPAGGLRYGRPTVVGVSTRPGDEVRLLDAVDQLERRPLVVLAPRHLERVEEVSRELVRRGLRVERRRGLDQVADTTDVVLVDTLGDLAADLADASVAVIGGTFDSAIGGHSPWAAAKARVAVLAGPHGASQGRAFDEVGAHRVTEATLASTLSRLLASRTRSRLPVTRAPAAWRAALEALGAPAPESVPRPWALPLAPGWSLVAAATRASRRRHRAPVPVIGVGSANARGPGRTSLVRALVRELHASGHTVGVALRGYRRSDDGAPGLSGDPVEVGRIGDEGAVHARAGALVAADPDRARAVDTLVAHGVTVIVVDDGMLRGDLAFDLSIAVVDARFPTARGPLPAGERRPGRLAATWRVATHAGAGFPLPPGMLRLERRPGPWMRGDALSGPPSGPVVAVAGIARPADFFDSLDIPVALRIPLRDHAAIDRGSIERRAAGRPVVMTGKDAARLSSEARSRIWWRDLDVGLPEPILAGLPPGPR
ncbi:MAG: tetraacyldisaccharide 4'-kinase, partial [Myxococcota bacterium]